MERFVGSFKRTGLIAVIVGIASLQVVSAQVADEELAEGLDVARYTASNELIYPADTDRWVVVGANIGGDYSQPEFDPSNPGMIGVVQMEPSAYAYLQQHGGYADGTMFLLSFYQTQEKPEPGLNGFVQGDLAGLEIHVIDRVKYEDNRGFYLFARDEQRPSAMIPPGNECVQCHAEHADFDGTFIQFYPTIRGLVPRDPD